MRTPWGESDSVVELSNGIRRVGTPSHGGYWVPAKLLPQIPQRFQDYARKWSGSPQWYEEDCAWACVAVTFPDVFDWSAGETLAHAQQIIDRYVDKVTAPQLQTCAAPISMGAQSMRDQFPLPGPQGPRTYEVEQD